MKKKVLSEQTALTLLLKGREEGIEYFFEEYYTPICYFVRGLVEDNTIAEEITADAFVKLWDKRTELGEEGSIKALLYQIARNSAIDYLRKRKRMAVHEAGLHYLPAVTDKTVLEKMAEAEMLKEITTTLNKLPAGCSEVFKLAYLLGKTDKEIARELNISHHTVRNQKLRAVRLLQKRIVPIIVLLSLLSFGPPV